MENKVDKLGQGAGDCVSTAKDIQVDMDNNSSDSVSFSKRLHPGVEVRWAPGAHLPNRSYAHFKRGADGVCSAVENRPSRILRFDQSVRASRQRKVNQKSTVLRVKVAFGTCLRTVRRIFKNLIAALAKSQATFTKRVFDPSHAQSEGALAVIC